MAYEIKGVEEFRVRFEMEIGVYFVRRVLGYNTL